MKVHSLKKLSIKLKAFTMEMLKTFNGDFKALLWYRRVYRMHVSKVEEHIYLVDVETAGIEGFIASYVLRGETVAVVETGPTSSIPNLISGLRELNIKPNEVAYVAVSHIHLDHGGGAGALLKHLPKAKVIVHQRGVAHLANPEKLWQQSRDVLKGIAEVYGKPEPVSEDRIIAAADGMSFDLGNGVQLKVIETLGHASHHLSYFEPLSNGIFCGDAAGVYLSEFDVHVPTTPPPFRLDIALSSLNKLANLKPRILYYSHFGKAENAINRLQTYGEQLKLWAKMARQGLEKRESLNEIMERIVVKDAFLNKAQHYVRAHPILSQTVFNESILGIFDFVKNYGDFNLLV
jgi:glyoxylase-like metal-dependent hydrolase (beta-lactamase superfamily II)